MVPPTPKSVAALLVGRPTASPASSRYVRPMNLTPSVLALALTASLLTACSGSGTPRAAGPSHTPTATPCASLTAPKTSYAAGIFHGPGFELPLPRKPAPTCKTVSISGEHLTAWFYDVAEVHYDIVVMTMFPFVLRAGHQSFELRQAMTTFWSNNGPALTYRVSIGPLRATEVSLSELFSGKGASGQVLGQAASKDNMLFMVAIRADSPGPFTKYRDSVDKLALT